MNSFESTFYLTSELLPLVPINIVDDSADTKKLLPPAYPDPQAPITRRGILPSFCNPGRTVEIRDEDLVKHKHKFENLNRSND